MIHYIVNIHGNFCFHGFQCTVKLKSELSESFDISAVTYSTLHSTYSHNPYLIQHTDLKNCKIRSWTISVPYFDNRRVEIFARNVLINVWHLIACNGIEQVEWLSALRTLQYIRVQCNLMQCSTAQYSSV